MNQVSVSFLCFNFFFMAILHAVFTTLPSRFFTCLNRIDSAYVFTFQTFVLDSFSFIFLLPLYAFLKIFFSIFCFYFLKKVYWIKFTSVEIKSHLTCTKYLKSSYHQLVSWNGAIPNDFTKKVFFFTKKVLHLETFFKYLRTEMKIHSINWFSFD